MEDIIWLQSIKEEIKPKKKWKKSDFKRYGNPFKLLIQVNDNEDIIQVMEKPNFKKIEGGILASGAHIIPAFPERNHLDYYKNGKGVKVEKTPNKNHIIGLI